MAHEAHHALPVALFLACLLAALGPDLMRDTDTLLMRAVYFADVRFASFFQKGTEEAQLNSKRPDISIVSLTPEAYARYLLRTSPAPRARLACVLFAFEDALDEALKDQPLRPPAVIGIDIDITPVEAVPTVWSPTPEEKGCHHRLLAYAETIRKKGPRMTHLTAQAAVALAVTRLAEKHCVVAIAFPHPGQTEQQSPNEFLEELQKTHLSTQRCPVLFATSDLLQVPHEYVSEYATVRRVFTTLPRRLQDELGPSALDALPELSCSMGRVLGALLRSFGPNPGKIDCLDPKASDAIKEANPSAYETRSIRLGPARAAITYSVVRPTASVDAGTPGNLFQEALAAFTASVQRSDLFILTADSGTAADKFLVPVVERPVQGAWVHAAVALTEEGWDAGDDDGDPHDAAHFFRHVGIDLVWAFVFIVLAESGLEAARTIRNPVGRDIAVALVPVLALSVLLVVLVMLAAKDFAAGKWASPALLILGMAAHLYVDLATSNPDPQAHPADPPGADRLRWVLQAAWCIALAAVVLRGAWPTLDIATWPRILAPVALGLVHLALARAYPFVPLPWRASSCSHPLSLPAGGRRVRACRRAHRAFRRRAAAGASASQG